MKKTLSVLTKVAGVAGIALAGYVVVTTLPDVVRYIKISTM